MTIGENEAEQQRAGKSNDDKKTIQPEAAVIIGKKVNGGTDKQWVPQAVKNDKIVAKGNRIIQQHITDPVITGGRNQLLHKKKQQQIDRNVQHIPGRGPLMQKIFQLCHHRVLTSEKDNLNL